MKKDAVKRGIAAFSRAELFFCLAALALLFAAILPGAALSGHRSDHITCIDNLRRIGRGFHVWAFEHQDGNPWTVPVTSDGTALSGHLSKPGNAWFEFAAVSNELVTPRLLVCPADSKKLVNQASNWSTSSSGGYANSKYRNNATSYTIGLHSGIEAPRALLSSDRNLQVDSLGQSCSFGLLGVATISPVSAQTGVAWTNDLHGVFGNLLLNDGSVLQKSTDGLREYFRAEVDDNTSQLHMLLP
jgi:hypothetical protein